MNETAELKRLVTGKDQIVSFAEGVIREVKAGDQNPLEVKVLITALKKSLEIIEEGIKDSVLSEATKHGKNFDFYGAKICIKENGQRYDFKNCNYPKWNLLDVQELSVKEKKKEAEAFLKTVKEPFELVDTETGETFRIHPPTKSSTSGLSISFT